jgi:hypothetical protein
MGLLDPSHQLLSRQQQPSNPQFTANSCQNIEPPNNNNGNIQINSKLQSYDDFESNQFQKRQQFNPTNNNQQQPSQPHSKQAQQINKKNKFSTIRNSKQQPTRSLQHLNSSNNNNNLVQFYVREGISSAYASLYSHPFGINSEQQQKIFTPRSKSLSTLSQLNTVIPFVSHIIPDSNHYQQFEQNQFPQFNIYYASEELIQRETICHLNYLHTLCTAYMYSIQFDFVNGFTILNQLSSPTSQLSQTLIDSITSSNPQTNNISDDEILQHLDSKSLSFSLLPYKNVSLTSYYLYIKGLLLANINEPKLSIECFEKYHQFYQWSTLGMDIYSTQLHILNERLKLGFLTTYFTNLAPRAYETLIILGNTFSLRQEHDNCIRSLVLATTINNNNVNNNCNHRNLDQSYPYVLLGYEYQENNELDKAILSFQKALLIDQYNYKAVLALGYIQLEQDLIDNALMYFKRAIAINKYSTSLYTTLARIYGQLSMFKESKELLFNSLRIEFDISVFINIKQSLCGGENTNLHSILRNITQDSDIDTIINKLNQTNSNTTTIATNKDNTHIQKKIVSLLAKSKELSRINPSSFATTTTSTKRGQLHTKFHQTMNKINRLGSSLQPEQQQQQIQIPLGSKLSSIYNDSQNSSQSGPNPLPITNQLAQNVKPTTTTKTKPTISPVDESLTLLQIRSVLSHVFFGTPSPNVFKSSSSTQNNNTDNTMNDDVRTKPTQSIQATSLDVQFITKLSVLIFSKQHFITPRILLILFLYITHYSQELLAQLLSIQQSIDNYDVNNNNSNQSAHFTSPLYQQHKKNFIQSQYSTRLIPLLIQLYSSISFLQLLLSIQSHEVNFLYILAKIHCVFHSLYQWYLKLLQLYPTYTLLPNLQSIHLIEYNNFLLQNGLTPIFTNSNNNNNTKTNMTNDFIDTTQYSSALTKYSVYNNKQRTQNPQSSLGSLSIFNQPIYQLNHEQLALNYITYAIILNEQQFLELQATQNFFSIGFGSIF